MSVECSSAFLHSSLLISREKAYVITPKATIPLSLYCFQTRKSLQKHLCPNIVQLLTPLLSTVSWSSIHSQTPRPWSHFLVRFRTNHVPLLIIIPNYSYTPCSIISILLFLSSCFCSNSPFFHPGLCILIKVRTFCH